MKNNIYYIVLLLTVAILYACGKKERSDTAMGSALIKVSVNSEIDDSENEAEVGQKAAMLSSGKQEGTISFSENTDVTYTVFPSTQATRPQLNNSKGSALSAAIIRKNLVNGIKYVLLAYDESGGLVAERVYIYGSESNTSKLLLDAGKTYSFIAYSVNSSDVLPTAVEKEKLATLKLSKVANDLMTFSSKVKLNEGTNFLGIVLKHRYSLITTQLSVDPSTVGTFKNISSAAFKPAHENATYSFATDAMEYGSQKPLGCPAVFPAIAADQRTVLSTPSLIISPATSAATLNFGTITIADETKNNFIVPKVKITPGVSYTLKLNFKTCTEDVGSVQGMDWRYPEVFVGEKSAIFKDGKYFYRGETITREIIAPGADYGFVFDITELDNAFNMELNGVKLAKNEIQFERGASSVQNIRFKDKSLYQGINTEGGANIGAVYNMKGTKATPLVKVVIGKNGEVALYGSKKSNGPLYELELFNGNSFNTFKWNGSNQGDNNIKVTQLVDGRTILVGSGSGKKKVACN
ncbi:fimbrillin family protein [Sphingobacterium hotanense]|uniref:fimbrillin family protein n=1 Tax=Sphingobacterium hotanense TaxID=649196 RepID=UPI0021A7E29D|nr:fimbrillin family protein [Sphingobacterium hotanense]MCT1524533.1 fimbrillin family protein [Sphingobacterium hotanense]